MNDHKDKDYIITKLHPPPCTTSIKSGVHLSVYLVVRVQLYFSYLQTNLYSRSTTSGNSILSYTPRLPGTSLRCKQIRVSRERVECGLTQFIDIRGEVSMD